MPKVIELPAPPSEELSNDELASWRLQYEIKRLLQLSGQELAWLEDNSPMKFGWWKTLLYGYDKYRPAKQVKLSELYMMEAMPWGGPPSPIHRRFNWCFLHTGKAKTAYETELEKRINAMAEFIQGLLPDLNYAQGLRAQSYLDRIKPAPDGYGYPELVG